MPSKFFPIFILLMLALTACVTPTQGSTDRRVYSPPPGAVYQSPEEVTETVTQSIATVAQDGYEASVTFTFDWTMRRNQIRTANCEAFVKPGATNLGIEGLHQCFVRYMHNDIIVEIDSPDGNLPVFNVASSDFVCKGYQPKMYSFGGFTYQNTSGTGNANPVSCSSSGFFN